MFPDKLGAFMTGTLRAWAFDLDPSGSEFLERMLKLDVTVSCDLNMGLQVRLHPQPSFYPLVKEAGTEVGLGVATCLLY